jgi:hypothetical protein
VVEVGNALVVEEVSIKKRGKNGIFSFKTPFIGILTRLQLG